MKNAGKKLLALLLSLAVLLSGCGGIDVVGFFGAMEEAAGISSGGGSLKKALSEGRVIPYSEMEYTRPDMEAMEALLENVRETASGGDLDGTLDGIYELYDAYDRFYTAYSLADIRYSGDLTSAKWEEEYQICGAASGQVDGMLEELYRILALSPLSDTLEGEDYFGAGFFDDYRGESIYSDEFLALLEEENALISRYYQLSGEAPSAGVDYGNWWNSAAQVLADLIRVRQQQAQCQGYNSYVDFAWDFYYDRDYTPEAAGNYLSGIREALTPLYRELTQSDAWNGAWRYASEDATLAYLRTATENMGGTVLDAFRLMEAGELYDISYGENKYNSSFEVYLTSYGEPFLFMNPELTRYDSLTIAHEFGHFCSDYASFGSTVGIDVSEIFSQGMEYLSLCYGEDTQDLVRVKLAASLSIYVEQGCYAAFEQSMYSLTENALTPEGLRELYEEIALSFGFDSVGYDPGEFVTVTHFYTNPMYVISYVVSNDAAMQLYALERETTGEGLRRLEQHLDTQESFFLAFLESAGLERPFDRLDDVRAFFEKEL